MHRDDILDIMTYSALSLIALCIIVIALPFFI